MATTFRRTFARALTTAVALLIASTLFSVSTPAAPAQAAVATTTATTATPTTTSTTTRTASPAPSFGSRVVSTAATRKGSPYVYGAVGPRRFDCSGLTMWTFRKLHKSLPHSSAAQYGRTKHIRARDRRPGDLVFFHGRGGIYHVAIYAGHNMIWHAPYSGTRVRKERLWTSSVYYGRVR